MSPQVVMKYPWQQRPRCIAGSDWGGCTKSRKTTSGEVIMLGKHMIKTYSEQP